MERSQHRNETETHEQIRQKFQDAKRVVVMSHIRPDGDAIGSIIGLGLGLKALGKQVQMILTDGVPSNFRYLAGSDQVQRSIRGEYDLAVVVDCSDLLRVGGALNERKPDINIDHHVTNLRFAETNLVIPEAVATAAILAEFMPAWGLPVDQEIATALLTGIVTDTIGFRTSNMTPQALRLSADLMEKGANLPDLYTKSLVTKTYEAVRLWGMGLGRIQREDQMVWTTLTLEDRQAASYPGNDDADLVNVLASIDADVAVIFVEQKDQHVKISWRARPGFDVSKIALQFGGGGHAAAAGADVPGTLSEVQPKVLEATRTMLAGVYANSLNH